MQYHLFEDKAGLLNKARRSNMLNARHIYHVPDTYVTLGSAMHVSEVTVPSHEGSAEGLELQAHMVENLCRLWFSHPAVGSIVWWNLADGFAFRHPSDPTGTKMPTAPVFCATICRQSPPMMCSTVPLTPNGTPKKRPKRAKTALRPSPDFTAPTPSPYRTAAKRRTRPFTLKKEKQMIR